MKTALFSKVFADSTLSEAIERTADLGYDGIEIMGRDPHLGPDSSIERAERVAALLDRHGLGMPCLATYTGGYVEQGDIECEAELDALDSFLDLADVLDCSFVRHGPDGPPVHEADERDFERAAAWMRRAADRAADHGVTLGIEIHARKLSETVESTLDLIERIDRENVAAIHDAGNMYIVDTDYGPDSIEELGDRLGHVHVKDLRRVEDPDLPDTFTIETRHGEECFQSRLLGEGAVDHRPLVDALADAGYEGYLTAERTPLADTTPVETARHERKVLDRLVADATG